MKSCTLVDTTLTGPLGPSGPFVALVLRASGARAAGHHGVPRALSQRGQERKHICNRTGGSPKEVCAKSHISRKAACKQEDVFLSFA